MRDAGLRVYLVVAFALTACAAQAPDRWPPQNFWSGMEGKLKLRMMLEEHDPNKWGLVNLSPAGLVAVRFRHDCPDLEPSRRAAGGFDAALTGARPIATEDVMDVPQRMRGCTLWLDAAIWADGTEIGDSEQLAEIHEERKMYAEELSGAVARAYGVLRRTPREARPEWNPEPVIKALQKRAEDLSMAAQEGAEERMNGARCAAIGFIVGELRTYRTGLAEKPSRYRGRGLGLVPYLAKIEAHLQDRAYTPTSYWDP